MNESLVDEAHSAPSIDEDHSDHMFPVDGSRTQGLDGIRLVPAQASVAPATVPRYTQGLDGDSYSSLQSLLRESTAPAFVGEGPSLVPNPTCTNIQAHSRRSELKPRGGHVEQGPR